jgi:hypothetical protein
MERFKRNVTIAIVAGAAAVMALVVLNVRDPHSLAAGRTSRPNAKAFSGAHLR